MQKTLVTSRIGTSLATIFSLAMVSFLPFLAYKTYFADSEIWSINLGYHFAEDAQNYWVFSRAFFYSTLFIFTRFFSDPQYIFLSARALMLVNTFLQIFLVFHVVKKYISQRFAHWFAVLILVANTFYLTQSFRIRSDLIATTVLLAAIYFFIKHKEQKKTSLWLIGGAGLALITTPKALFLLPVLAIFYLGDQPNIRRWKYVVLISAALGLTFVCSLYLRLGALSDLTMDLHKYLLSTFKGEEGNPSYLSARSFTYVTKLFTENPWLALLWVTPYILPFRKIDRKWLSIHTYLLLLLFLAPEKLPFYICSLLPFFACSTTLLFYSYFSKLNKSFARSLLTVLAVLTIFGGAALKLTNALHEDQNTDQFQAINAINDYLVKYPDTKYYDVIGLTPKFSNLRHFAGPNQVATNKIVADLIVQEKPDMILKVAKLDYLGTTMALFLNEQYIHIGNGFYMKAFPIPDNLKSIKNFLKLESKKELSALSPLFEKYEDQSLLFEVKDAKGNLYVFESIQNFLADRPPGEVTVVKVSPMPVPQQMPSRNIETLFKFDTSF